VLLVGEEGREGLGNVGYYGVLMGWGKRKGTGS